MTAPELTVKSGAITALRLFDIAHSADLGKAEALWAGRTAVSSRRSQLTATPAKAMTFGVPPLNLALEPVRTVIEGREVDLVASARLYDFGVIALALRLPAADRSWTDYVSLFNAMDRLVGPAGTSTIWDSLLRILRSSLAEALLQPNPRAIQEDYLLASVQQWDEPVTASSILERIDLVPLLSGERRKLSESARRDLLRQSFSYYEDDLVVLTWDRVFIYEPRSDTDVADVLEVANAQLLEMRYYDELLDEELPRIYDRVELARGTRSVLASRRYVELARKLHTLVAEVTELMEKVDNALQVTEDVYLARVYTAALDTFRVPAFSAAVQRKLSIIRDTYIALNDEATGVRGELLELAIIALILLEIVIALLRS
jgi:hypothetical protein